MWYVGICTEQGNLVHESDAAEYVKARGYIGNPEVVVPWFFSGNWIKEEEDPRARALPEDF